MTGKATPGQVEGPGADHSEGVIVVDQLVERGSQGFPFVLLVSFVVQLLFGSGTAWLDILAT